MPWAVVHSSGGQSGSQMDLQQIDHSGGHWPGNTQLCNGAAYLTFKIYITSNNAFHCFATLKNYFKHLTCLWHPGPLPSGSLCNESSSVWWRSLNVPRIEYATLGVPWWGQGRKATFPALALGTVHLVIGHMIKLSFSYFFSDSPALSSETNYSSVFSEIAWRWENLEAGKQKRFV